MVQKTYFLGKFREGTSLSDKFLIGIYRQGEGTVPFPKETVNGVKNDITTRFINNIDNLKGYLIAVIGEYQFEGFDVNVKMWNDDADNLFQNYLKDVPEFYEHIGPISDENTKDLDSIAGLNIQK